MTQKHFSMRWTPLRKARIVAAITSGQISQSEAGAQYDISQEELNRWIALSTEGGVRALRGTRVQEYRGAE